MSKKYPIISVAGSSGAGTSAIRHTFEQIFRRENVTAATIQGNAFDSFTLEEMKRELERRSMARDGT